jgi:hypothetical protein
MSGLIYSLCAATALGCAWMLLRTYVRLKSRLLLWSGLCFVGLALNNFLLVIDRSVQSVDLSTLRLIPAVIGMGLLVFGLIWENK